jgi:hypothetical protein
LFQKGDNGDFPEGHESLYSRNGGTGVIEPEGFD